MSQSTLLRPRATQSGAVLVTGLVFLLVLTMFVLALVRSGSLEERMARNARDQQVAREAAEAVLRDAESLWFTKAPFDPYNASAFTSTCVNGLCFKPAAAASWANIDWKDEKLTLGFSQPTLTIPGLTTQPRYVIEVVTQPTRVSSAVPCQDGVARITAHGQGNGGATAFLQTTVRFHPYTNICD